MHDLHSIATELANITQPHSHYIFHQQQSICLCFRDEDRARDARKEIQHKGYRTRIIHSQLQDWMVVCDAELATEIA